MSTENTQKLRDLVAWLRRQGDKRVVGNWALDADCMCVPADSCEQYRGDIGGLVVTEMLKAAEAKAIHDAAEDVHPRRTVAEIWMKEFGIRGEFYETFVDVDEVLEDYPGLHDQLTCNDYATTLEKYLDRGVRGEVSWKWYVENLLATAVP